MPTKSATSRLYEPSGRLARSAATVVTPSSYPGPSGRNGRPPGGLRDGGRPLRVQRPRQRACVRDRERLPVVVEVGPRLASPGLDPRRPLLDLRLGVVAVPAPAAVVEADVRPGRVRLRGLERLRGVVSDH